MLMPCPTYTLTRSLCSHRSSAANPRALCWISVELFQRKRGGSINTERNGLGQDITAVTAGELSGVCLQSLPLSCHFTLLPGAYAHIGLCPYVPGLIGAALQDLGGQEGVSPLVSPPHLHLPLVITLSSKAKTPTLLGSLEIPPHLKPSSPLTSLWQAPLPQQGSCSFTPTKPSTGHQSQPQATWWTPQLTQQIGHSCLDSPPDFWFLELPRAWSLYYWEEKLRQ